MEKDDEKMGMLMPCFSCVISMYTDMTHEDFIKKNGTIFYCEVCKRKEREKRNKIDWRAIIKEVHVHPITTDELIASANDKRSLEEKLLDPIRLERMRPKTTEECPLCTHKDVVRARLKILYKDMVFEDDDGNEWWYDFDSKTN